MLQLYLHDLSPYSREDLNAQGEYNYPYFTEYWHESDRQSYSIRLFEKLVGFVFVNSYNILSDSEYSIAEFFILRLYRRQGIGKIAASEIFNQNPGIWETRVLPTNQGAYKFWKQIIINYAGLNHKELIKGVSGWKGPIFQFNSRSSANHVIQWDRL